MRIVTGNTPFSSYPNSGIAAAVANGSALLFQAREIKENTYTIEVTAID